MYVTLYVYLVRVIWNGNGVVRSEHRTVRNLVEWDEVGAPHGSHSLHLLPHQAVHRRQATVLRAWMTTPFAPQPHHQQQGPTHTHTHTPAVYST